jgi:transposase
MRIIRDVLRHRHECGAGVRDIAASCGIGRTTVSEYLRRAQAAGLSWPLPEDLDDEALNSRLFPPKPGEGEPARPVPDWALIHKEAARKGVTLTLLWQEYKKRNENGYGYSQFAALYRRWLKTTDVRMLQRHRAGERLFVDFAGQTMRLSDPKTGEVRQVQVFVASLGMSQYIFAKACQGQDLGSWLEVCTQCLEFYGGVPRTLVPDNLKAAVSVACRYEPELNRSYAEWAKHYKLGVVPARPRKPRDKARVENAVLQVERWVLAPLRDRVFFSLEEIDEAVGELLKDLNEKPMKAMGASRRELFASEDLPALAPLPAERFVFAQWKKAKVAPDYHVEFERHRYSVPYTLVSQRVDLRVAHSTLEVFLGGKRICGHPRSLRRGGFTTDESHMPEAHRAYAEWTPARFANWARAAGPNVVRFVELFLASKIHPEHGFRPCLGLLSLAKIHSGERLDAACGRALRLGALDYKVVKNFLDNGLEREEDAPAQPALPLHGNVRGGAYYSGEEPCGN